MATSISDRYAFLGEQRCSIEWPRSGPHKGGVLLRIPTVKNPYVGKTLDAAVDLAMSFIAESSEGPAMKTASTRKKPAAARA